VLVTFLLFNALLPPILVLPGAFFPTDHELVRALRQVLDDNSFKVNAPATIAARKSAGELLNWCLDTKNSEVLHKFTKSLTDSFAKVIKPSFNKSFAYNNDKLWKKFFLLRSSSDFIQRWMAFIKLTALAVKPVLYQHLTDIVFRRSLEEYFQMEYLSEHDGTEDEELTGNERGVLRYVTGYICRHLREKLERGSHPFKEEMVLCLMELVKSDQDADQVGLDEEWTDLLDRGGLWRVKECTYQFFRAVEDVSRRDLKKLARPVPISKLQMIKNITDDEDVQFYWVIVSADFEIDDQEIHDALLEKITELYVNVRGFSYASGWIEKHKQRTKQATQRSKSLRRDVHDEFYS